MTYGKSIHNESPNGEHWAIITTSSVFVPGDERSRSHPGHGYPDSYENTASYSWYKTEEDMVEALKSTYGNSSFGIYVGKVYKKVQEVKIV